MVLNRRLAAELKQLRENTGMIGEAVAQQMGWSPSKVSRIERCRGPIPVPDVERLLDLYRAGERQRKFLLDLAEVHAYTALAGVKSRPQEVERYEDADVVLDWGGPVFPWFLQTGDYARAVLESYQEIFRRPPSVVTQMVDDILASQARLDAGDRPQARLGLRAFFDESALLRQYGGPDVMRGQLTRILDLAVLPNVEVRAVTFAAPGPAGLGPFTYAKYSTGPGPAVWADAVLLRDLRGDQRLDTEDLTYLYFLAFREMAAAAESEEVTLAMIRDALGDLD